MLGGAGASLAQNAVTADTVVATVNGTEITLGHLIQAREVLPAQYRDLPPEVLFDGLRDQLVHTDCSGAVDGAPQQAAGNCLAE